MSPGTRMPPSHIVAFVPRKPPGRTRFAGAIVTEKPDQRVVGHTELGERFANSAHGAIDTGHLGIVMLLRFGQILIRLSIGSGSFVRLVRRTETDKSKEGFLGLGAGPHKLDGRLGHHIRAFPFDRLGLLSLSAQHGIDIEPVIVRNTAHKTALQWAGWAVRFDGPQMPFAEMPRNVTGRLERLGQRHFFGV